MKYSSIFYPVLILLSSLLIGCISDDLSETGITEPLKTFDNFLSSNESGMGIPSVVGTWEAYYPEGDPEYPFLQRVIFEEDSTYQHFLLTSPYNTYLIFSGAYTVSVDSLKLTVLAINSNPTSKPLPPVLYKYEISQDKLTIYFPLSVISLTKKEPS